MARKVNEKQVVVNILHDLRASSLIELLFKIILVNVGLSLAPVK